MLKQAVRKTWLPASLLALALAACGPEHSDSIAAVTIEVACGSSADCPTGFECNPDVEHGPPTALCESPDPAASCPAGFETKVRYGQTFCKPPASLDTRAGRTADATSPRFAGP
ncbi:MAG TPA: hypothetical protein VHW23_08360 [Kofleriaceae bacterium]|jgi:Cys-rich repeat protein|nr:hypothetical protein [Kofleriaceae bacterium]